MNINEIITILENRIGTLHNSRAHAVATGDLTGVIATDAQIEETNATLEKLKAANA